jgi:hypothetical protein
MAHKGYTLNYFIDFFSNIPTSQWTTCDLVDEVGRCCVLGHAGDAANSNLRVTNTYNTRSLATKARANALAKFFGGARLASAVNDGSWGYEELGKNPRARILRALRNRKRYGNVLGNK